MVTVVYNHHLTTEMIKKKNQHAPKNRRKDPPPPFLWTTQMRGLCTLLLPLQRWAIGDSLPNQGGPGVMGWWWWQHGGKGWVGWSPNQKNTTWKWWWLKICWILFLKIYLLNVGKLKFFWGGFQSQVNNDIWTGLLKFRLFSAGWSVVRWLRC